MKPLEVVRIVTSCDAVTIASAVFGLSIDERRAFENRIIARALKRDNCPGVEPADLHDAIVREIMSTRIKRKMERERLAA